MCKGAWERSERKLIPDYKEEQEGKKRSGKGVESCRGQQKIDARCTVAHGRVQEELLGGGVLGGWSKKPRIIPPTEPQKKKDQATWRPLSSTS